MSEIRVRFKLATLSPTVQKEINKPQLSGFKKIPLEVTLANLKDQVI